MPRSTLIAIWVGVGALALVLDVALIMWVRWRRSVRARGQAPAAALRAAVWSAAPQLRRAGPVVGLVALAALPPLLVVADRWANPTADYSDLAQVGRALWCQWPALCQVLYPPYILIVFLAALVVVGALALARSPWLAPPPLALALRPAAPLGQPAPAVRRLGLALAGLAGLGLLADGGLALARALATTAAPEPTLPRLPGAEWAALLALGLLGWALADLPWPRLLAALRPHADWVWSYAVAHAALVAFIIQVNGERQFPWLTLALLAAAGLNLLRVARRVPLGVWVVTLALIGFSLYLNAWWASSIGDEYAFFFDARRIATLDTWAQVSAMLFDRNGVYGTHPYFSSLLQAVPLKLFGPTGAAWRFSAVYPAALSVGLFYLFVRAYASRAFALTAALLLAASHYLMAFSKIGYNNLQALFALTLVLAVAVWAARSRLPVAFAALGLSLSFCFYVYPAALYALPAGLLVLAGEARPRTRADWGRWLLLAAAALAGLFPLLLQPEYWRLKQQGTFLYNPELAGSLLSLARHLLGNLVYAFGSFLYIPQEGHLVVASFVDPLSGALGLLGLGAWLRAARTNRAARWLLLVALVELFFVGATHDRLAPPTTRMFLLLPGWALLGAAGVRWLWQGLGALGRVRRPALAAALVVVLLALNLYQAYPLSRARFTDVQSLEASVVRLSQLAQRLPVAPPHYIFISDPSWGIDGLRLLPQLYPFDATFDLVSIETPVLPPETTAMLTDENAVIIIKPWLELGWQTALEPQLAALGKTACEVVAADGGLRMRLWHAPHWDALCAPPPPAGPLWFIQGL